MAVVRKKQDDKVLKTLRELVTVGGNKECFDCGQKGPTYINMTIGSFVCTTCSGILRGLTPPHRVKSISMATFTQEEIDFVRQNGNDTCSRTWLGLWDPKRAIKQEHRDFMIDKYERKRYYLEPASPLKSLPSNTTSSTTSLSASNGISTSSSNLSSRNGAENLVPLKTITLTPPTSLRLSRTNSNSSSGLNGNSSQASSVTGSSTNLKFQQQFTPDDSNFFSDPPKILPPTPQKHSSHHHQRLNGTVNGNAFERSQKNGLLTSASNGHTNSSNSNNNANKFTPDSDFVADFSNANIVSVNGGATTASNGLKNSGNHKLSNGFNENGNLTNGYHQNQNGNGQPNGEIENFADFEHNTIYNAAGNMSGSGSFFSNSNSIDSSTTNSSSSTTSVNSINNDIFINNYSLLNNNNSANNLMGNGGGVSGTADLSNLNGNQFTAFGDFHPAVGGAAGSFCAGPGVQRTNGYSYFQNYQPGTSGTGGSSSLNFTSAANSATNNSYSGNLQWNLWQQFNQWPPHDPPAIFGGSMGSLSGSCQSKPSSTSLIRSHQHQPSPQPHLQNQQHQQPHHHSSNQNRWSLPISGSAKSSTTLSSATPSVDRYAALKDLDDQFREIKFEHETNNNNTNGTSSSTASSGLINGNHANDVHQVSSANPFKTANPFQQPAQQTPTLNWTIPGTTPPSSNGFYATSPYQNGFVHPHLLQNGNVTNGVGFTNAFHHPTAVGPQFNGTATASANHFGHFGNPFMAGATTATSKSNNPFL
nr:arf-GAP domain and FG repeat-containing protein 1 isoform X1 [Aedes albopictus]XP_019549906.2 arf-GAP domain and FG repeat-containing protein 1 isoform X1 [Aedes albopictus]XP_019549907.2 arf-GAP domain and FG repeat-containing protein 1 isoform X1 [Aedes albopictus]XP_019549908.2 arf-GAP domain and FG repeat-containing protein 1 isoform X1 [Aedes albopictus]XP_019549909.2 arf-GAP domain and FG repeat-containing protein 1 isoform X1 [Aedes albopictus]XP_029713493.1 arf-GAP domain and FG rep